MKIALMCPTRNRPNKLITLLASILTTATHHNIIIVLGIDDDDPVKDIYYKLKTNLPTMIQLVEFKNKGKFLGLSPMWNEMVKQVNSPMESVIYAMIGDDMIFKTKDWDAKIIEEFQKGPEDKLIMVHCNDGMRGPGNKYQNVQPFPVNFFVHENYVKTVGYFVEPYVINIHQDTWCDAIFTNLKRKIYRHDILIKHLHFSETNGKMDQVSDNLEALRKGIWDNNDWAIQYKSEFEQELNKLRKAIEDYNNNTTR